MKSFLLSIVMSFLMVSFHANAQTDQCQRNPTSLNESIESISSVIEEVVAVTKKRVHFSGEITTSSMNRLKRRIDKVIADNNTGPLEITLTLDSTGGNLVESIYFVRYVRSIMNQGRVVINTQVSSNRDCESSCTILYTAGKQRFANRRSRFGFHSPRVASGGIEGMTREEIVEVYKNHWLNQVAVVDTGLAQTLRTNGYMEHLDMSYIDAEDLLTGYVTDIL